METIIGFAVGYLVGTRQGRDGVERLRTTVQEIAASEEVRAIVGQAIALAAPVVRAVMRSARSGGDSDVAAALARSAADALKQWQKAKAA